MKFSLVYSELSSQWKIVLDTKLYWVFSHLVLSELGVQGSDPFLSSQYRLISFTSLPLSSGSSLFCSRYWLPIMSFLMALLLQEFQSLTNTDRALPPSYRHLLGGRLSSFRHYFLVGWGKSDCRQRRQISLEKMILWLDTHIYWFIRSQVSVSDSHLSNIMTDWQPSLEKKKNSPTPWLLRCLDIPHFQTCMLYTKGFTTWSTGGTQCGWDKRIWTTGLTTDPEKIQSKPGAVFYLPTIQVSRYNAKDTIVYNFHGKNVSIHI